MFCKVNVVIDKKSYTILGYINQNGYTPSPVVVVVKDDNNNKLSLVFPNSEMFSIVESAEEVFESEGLIRIIEEKKYSFSGAERYMWDNIGNNYIEVIEGLRKEN